MSDELRVDSTPTNETGDVPSKSAARSARIRQERRDKRLVLAVLRRLVVRGSGGQVALRFDTFSRGASFVGLTDRRGTWIYQIDVCDLEAIIHEIALRSNGEAEGE